MSGLTTFGRSVATAAATLLLLGLAFGSFPYLLGALFLAGVAFSARGLAAPEVKTFRAVSATDVRAGDAVDVILEVENLGAEGAVSIHDKPPDAFLLSSGSNFGAQWLPPSGRVNLAYSLKAPRRGSHSIGPIRVAAYDPLFLQSARVSAASDVTELLVHPKTPAAPRIRTSAAWGRAQLPGGDRATRGILTNDFRELRPYERGDPLRSVNWKATARMSRERLNLVVNDYEVEGKKAVWLFCDASAYTVGGTTSESVFDELASASLTIGAHYLDMGHRVGFTLYGSGAARVLYADSGDLQERRMAALLASATPGGADSSSVNDDIARAVELTKGFLVREKPLIFVFTMAGRDASLAPALASARALASTGRRPAAVVCVAPEGDPDSSLASRLVGLREKAQLKGLERRGVTVIRYHPVRAPLVARLARGMLR